MRLRALSAVLDASRPLSVAGQWAADTGRQAAHQLWQEGQLSSATVSTHETKTGFVGLLTNSPLWIAVLCFSLAQLIKFGVTWYETKQFQYERLVGSGGMPSAHSAFVASLATAVGVRDGTGSSTFAVALIMACIVMYDAVGLRLHTGRQALALNLIIAETLPTDHPVAPTAFGKLREQLGHTPIQVAAGGTLGFVIALVVQGALGSALH